MNVLIKNTEIQNIDDIFELEKQCFSRPWTKDQLEKQLDKERHCFICAEDEDGNTVGYIGLMHVLDEGYISNVAVDSRYRRLGIAGKLIEKLIEEAENIKLSFVTLEVRMSNTPAISLYEKHGFKKVGTRRKFYSHPVEDAVLMTRFLSEEQK